MHNDIYIITSIFVSFYWLEINGQYYIYIYMFYITLYMAVPYIKSLDLWWYLIETAYLSPQLTNDSSYIIIEKYMIVCMC